MTLLIALEAVSQRGRRKGTYLKLDHRFLEDEDFLTRIQIEWDQSQTFAHEDP